MSHYGTPGLDLAGLSMMGNAADDAAKAGEYYWAMKSRGMEIAQNILDLTDKWVEIQKIIASGKDDLSQKFAQAVSTIPMEGSDPISMAVYMTQVGSLFVSNFKPIVDQMDTLFVEPQEKLKTGAALFGWLSNNMASIAFKQMDAIQIANGIGSYVDSWAVAILARANRPASEYVNLSFTAEEWVSKVLAAAGMDMSARAPELRAVMVSAPATAAAKELLLNSMDKAGIASEYGIPYDQVDSLLTQVGLGFIDPLTISLIIMGISLLLAAGAIIYALVASGSAAAKVGKNEVDRLASVGQAEVDALKVKAAAILKNVNSIQDPKARQEATNAGMAELDASANDAKARLTVAATKAKENIDAAKGGIDWTPFVIAGGVGVGILIVLKVTKVI